MFYEFESGQYCFNANQNERMIYIYIAHPYKVLQNDGKETQKTRKNAIVKMYRYIGSMMVYVKFLMNY